MRVCTALLAILSAAAALAAPLRVGVFVDKGARSNGCAAWVRLLTSSPDFDTTFLDGPAVRGGALEGLDVLVMPGGHSIVESEQLEEAGREAIRRYIRNGGRYLGTCAGCSLTLNEPMATRLRVIPFSRDPKSPRGGGEALTMKVTKRGEELTGIKAGNHPVRYHNGPMLVPTKPLKDAEYEVIGKWNCDLSEKGTNSVSMFGHPALVCGRYGKGRVFVTAGHPEHYPRSRDIVVGGFRYLTGVAPKFELKSRSRGATCVGFYTPPMAGIETAKTLAALEKNPALDVVAVQNDDITAGRLEHLDALVLPDGDAAQYEKVYPEVAPYVEAFAERGGTTFAWGVGAKHLPKRGGTAAEDGMHALEALR